METREYIESLIAKARVAQKELETYSQERIDECVKAVGKAVYDNAEILAREAVDETRMGVYEDKVIKNKNKAKVIWAKMKGQKSHGIIERDEKTGLVKVAKPIGVLGAVTPTTNPNMTPLHNAMCAIKACNAMIACPHPRSKKSTYHTIELMRAALKAIGAPEDLVQCVEEPTLEASQLVMQLCDACISTGGPGMVKAAYSSSKPAFGVGAGNVQVLIDRDADLKTVAGMVVRGRSYDNGILCTCEQNVICPKEKFDELVGYMKEAGAYYIDDPAQIDAFRAVTFPNGSINKDFVGQSAVQIAKMAGLKVPEGTKVLLVRTEKCGADELFAKEKLCPIMAAFTYDKWDDAIGIASANLDLEGKGHSCSIHSYTTAHIEQAAEALSVSRFCVNQQASNSLGGVFTNGLMPTATLGCGTWGNNSLSENLWYTHLMNVSRIAYVIPGAKTPTDEEIWAK